MNFGSQDLQRQTNILYERSTAQIALLERMSADLEKKRRASLLGPCVLKFSARRCKLHRVQRGSRALPPREWSTTCGVRFVFWAFTLHPSSTIFPLDAMCSRCFAALPTTLARFPRLPIHVFCDENGWKDPSEVHQSFV